MGLVARGERAQQWRAAGPVPVGSEVAVEALVTLGGLSVDDVRVEVVAGEPDGEGASRRAPWCRRPTAARPGASTGSWPRCRRPRAAVRGGLAGRPVRLNGGGPDPSFLIAWEPDQFGGAVAPEQRIYPGVYECQPRASNKRHDGGGDAMRVKDAMSPISAIETPSAGCRADGPEQDRRRRRPRPHPPRPRRRHRARPAPRRRGGR